MDIQFTLVEDSQHSELLEQVSSHDLVIDWLNPEFGIYGVFSIESMALGRAVICSLTDSLYDKYNLPVVSIQPDALASKITEFYNNRKLLVEVGKAGHDFVQKFHNTVESAKKVVKQYESILR